jgi:hypothetical protein
MKLILLSFSVFLIAFSSYGQSKVTLDGLVTDEQSVPIEGVTILTNDGTIHAITDRSGKFRITMPSGTYTFALTHISYTNREFTHTFSSPDYVKLTMQSEALNLNEVIISDTDPQDNLKMTTAGLTQLSMKNIQNIPAFLGEVDVIKSITLLPGVSTVGEGAAGFNVRGGSIDQNLVMIDGMQLFNTSHVLGFFSIFHPDATRDFSLYKGHIPAKFGGRVSSVLDVKSLQGNKQDWGASIGVGTFSTRLAVDGPVTKKLSLLAAGRITYSDWILGQVKNLDVRNSSADFRDLFIRADQYFSDRHHLMISYLHSQDDFNFAGDFGFVWSNNGVNMNYDFQITPGTRFDLSASFLRYESTLSDFTEGLETELFNGMDKWQTKANLNLTPGKHTIDVGVEAILFDPPTEQLTPLNPASSIRPEVVNRSRGREMAAYLEDTYAFSSKFDLSLGLRLNVFQHLGFGREYEYEGDIRSDDQIIDSVFYASREAISTFSNLAPRLAARYELNPTTSLKLSYNRTYQYLHLISNTTAPTPVDQWQVSTRYIPPTQSDNFSLGIYKNFNNDKWVTSLEGFYKIQENIVEYKDFAELIVQENIESELLIGQGRAFGVELFLKHITPKWNSWISYVYTRALVSVDDPSGEINQGDWFPAYYDQPHAFKFVSDLRLGKRGSFAVNFIYNTGRPITALVSDYRMGNLVVPHYSDRNEYRIPNYMRMDVSFTIGNIFNKIDDKLNISIYNLLGRKNAYSVYYQRLDNQPIPQAYKLAVLGSAFPSLTYSLKL